MKYMFEFDILIESCEFCPMKINSQHDNMSLTWCDIESTRRNLSHSDIFETKPIWCPLQKVED
jgi:hypothetical protein